MGSTGFSRQKYPLGTIAAYGPDNARATKLVVSVFKRPGRTEPNDLRCWTTAAGDVRHDETTREGLEREASQVWGALAAESADIEALEVFPELRRAYDDGLIDPALMHPSELDEVEAAPRGRFLEETQDRHPPIQDVAEATRWWSDFQRGRRAEQLAELAERGGNGPLGGIERVETYHAPPKVGRNDPCPCGSGRKYKKCCGA